jgi:hypothetical protein
MYSKLANDSRKALLAEAKRLTREERLRAFVRHCKLVSKLSEAAKQARPEPSKVKKDSSTVDRARDLAVLQAGAGAPDLARKS